VTALAVLAAWLIGAAPTPTPPAGSPARVASGRWGGAGIAIEVTASGAKIEFDCASGTIDAPLVLDAEGRFDLPGTFLRQRPGPTRMGDEDREGESVRYSGRLEGDTLTLELHAPKQRHGTPAFSAVLGRTPRLHRCS
jgi:hypothetical protein